MLVFDVIGHIENSVTMSILPFV